MATNPPIHIGELVDVPAPGSGVSSPWAQEITNRIAHRFTSIADRTAKWPNASVPEGAESITLDTGTLWLFRAGAWVPLIQPATAWTALALSASWANSAGFQPLQFRRQSDRVYVRGEIVFTAGGGNPMATLPVGSRPPAKLSFGLVNRSGSPALMVDVETNGQLNVGGLSGTTTFGLGNLSFSIDP